MPDTTSVLIKIAKVLAEDEEDVRQAAKGYVRAPKMSKPAKKLKKKLHPKGRVLTQKQKAWAHAYYDQMDAGGKPKKRGKGKTKSPAKSYGFKGPVKSREKADARMKKLRKERGKSPASKKNV